MPSELARIGGRALLAARAPQFSPFCACLPGVVPTDQPAAEGRNVGQTCAKGRPMTPDQGAPQAGWPANYLDFWAPPDQ
jgi:hypothetical protein